MEKKIRIDSYILLYFYFFAYIMNPRYLSLFICFSLSVSFPLLMYIYINISGHSEMFVSKHNAWFLL